MRIAMGLQYDGAMFSGWQTQPGGHTLQDHLETAIAKFIGDSNTEIKTVTAGRTDAGVHALGQVIHFETEIVRPDWSWVRGVNSFLPKAMSIGWAKVVPQEFDARFSAFQRTYCYALLTGPCPVPLVAGKAGYLMQAPDKTLNVLAMQEAANYLIGEHDFSSFRSSECQSNTPIKTLYQLDVIGHGPWVYFIVRGNAFLHHMVRNLVGTLLAVGSDKEPPAWVREVLEAKNRQVAAPTFMPDGLYLAKVSYPDVFAIPEPNLYNSLIPVSVLKS